MRSLQGSAQQEGERRVKHRKDLQVGLVVRLDQDWFFIPDEDKLLSASKRLNG